MKRASLSLVALVLLAAAAHAASITYVLPTPGVT